MKYNLLSRTEKPEFNFYVKPNTSNFNYYLFNDYEKAMEKARLLSLSEFPVAIIREPMQDCYGEWMLEHTYTFIHGKCEMDDVKHQSHGLHAKFYIDAGEWLNPNEL